MLSWVKSLLLPLDNSSFKRRIVWTTMLDILFTLDIHICISKFYLSSQTTFYYSISWKVKDYSIFFLDQLCFNRSLFEGVWNRLTWFKKCLSFSFFLLKRFISGNGGCRESLYLPPLLIPFILCLNNVIEILSSLTGNWKQTCSFKNGVFEA